MNETGMTSVKQTTGWYRLLYLIPIVMISLHSCTEVGLNVTEDEYLTARPLKIQFDWTESNLEHGERPDSLTLIFDRLSDSSKVFIKVCSEDTAHSNVVLPNGEWICTVLNEKVQGMTLYGLDEFMAKDSCSMKAITARADTISYSELTGIRGYIDTNPGMPYYREIKGNVSGFGRVQVNGVSNNKLILPLKDLAVKAVFNLNVKIEEGVTVERMIGEVSGVPGIISLMDKEVVASSKGKTLFGVYPDGADGSRWNGSVKIAGIIPPVSSDRIIGDGILILRIYVLNEGERMVYVAAMNLKSLLDNKTILIPTDRSGIYHCSESVSYVFDIPSTLWLTPAGIRPCDDGLGMNEWVNGEKIGKEL